MLLVIKRLSVEKQRTALCEEQSQGAAMALAVAVMDRTDYGGS
jgi:hypothetical protein